VGLLEGRPVNYFDQVADRQLTNPQKTKERVKKKWEEKREAKAKGPSPLLLKQMDQVIIMGEYRKWRNQVRKEIQERHGHDFAALMRPLRNLNWLDADKIVTLVQDAAWLHQTDEATKLATLSYVDHALIISRIRHGLPPIDDGVMDEEPGIFIKIRRMLLGH
jgi:hypothetical protein